MKLPDKVYDCLKWIVLICIPAATVFYSVLDEVFHWGNADVVAKISAATCTFLGAILGFSTAEYNKGKNS
jgi:hypothetical protein